MDKSGAVCRGTFRKNCPSVVDLRGYIEVLLMSRRRHESESDKDPFDHGTAPTTPAAGR